VTRELSRLAAQTLCGRLSDAEPRRALVLRPLCRRPCVAEPRRPVRGACRRRSDARRECRDYVLPMSDSPCGLQHSYTPPLLHT
jgi:hypothetical protein